MSIADAIENRKKVFKVVLKTAGDPVPPVDVQNALQITEDSTLQLDAIEMNSQDDVVGRTFSLRSDITGTVGGNSTINGNLISTDQANEPAIADSLRISGQSVNEEIFATLVDVAVNGKEGDIVTGDTSTATGVIKIIDDKKVIIKLTTGVFQDDEDISVTAGVVGHIEDLDNLSFLMEPDSTSNQVGSVFLWEDGKLKSLRDAVGNFVVTMGNSGGLGKFALAFMGKDDEDNWIDIALPTASYGENLPGTFKNAQMNLSWDDGAEEYTPINTKIEHNNGTTPVFRMDSNDETGIGTARNSTRSAQGGSMGIEEDLFANFNPIALQKANKPIKLKFRIGDGTLGRTIYFRATINITGVAGSSTDGFKMHDITYKYVDNTDKDKDYYMVFI